jgi:putative phosphoesterase
MRVGILSDTHDQFERTRTAVDQLCLHGAEALIHCGDLTSPEILVICSVQPCWFVFGNHDADMVPSLLKAGQESGATCLHWGGLFEIDGTRLGVTHGHMHQDLRKVILANPEYLLTGHSHMASDSFLGSIRRINPGALHAADTLSVALLETRTGELTWFTWLTAQENQRQSSG